jgi:CRP/FNR family cyclic AMP-dependent transcriptional regulator
MSPYELKSALKQINIAEALREEDFDLLLEEGAYVEKEKGEFLFRENEKVTCFYVLMKGVVKNISTTTDGREVLKSIQHPKAIIDDLSICGFSHRTSSAIIMSPLAGIYMINIEVMEKILADNKLLACSVIKYLGRRLNYVEERLESFVLNDARERIVEFLKVNAESFGQAVGFEMLLKHNFTQQDIANYTGTSRQTVTMVLNDLKKHNKIHFKRQSILIRDIKALA